jgi:hypothetical protein
LLNNAGLLPTNDTRVEQSNPTTNFRTQDLGLSGSIGSNVNSILSFGNHDVGLKKFSSENQLESAVLTLTCKSPGGNPVFGIKAGSYDKSSYDARYANWNSPDESESWISGGAGSVDDDIDINDALPHTAEGSVNINVYNAAKAALKDFTAFYLVLFSSDADAATYYSLESAIASKRPVLTLSFRDGTSKERLGHATMPTIPSL